MSPEEDQSIETLHRVLVHCYPSTLEYLLERPNTPSDLQWVASLILVATGYEDSIVRKHS